MARHRERSPTGRSANGLPARRPSVHPARTCSRVTTTDGRSPGSRVIVGPSPSQDRDPSGIPMDDSPLTVAGAAPALDPRTANCRGARTVFPFSALSGNRRGRSYAGGTAPVKPHSAIVPITAVPPLVAGSGSDYMTVEVRAPLAASPGAVMSDFPLSRRLGAALRKLALFFPLGPAPPQGPSPDDGTRRAFGRHRHGPHRTNILTDRHASTANDGGGCSDAPRPNRCARLCVGRKPAAAFPVRAPLADAPRRGAPVMSDCSCDDRSLRLRERSA
ncbi:hypothetical protein FHW79_004853 [Azospirillum sp. OGB3]|nr:hypothetical protein [Azospirillum sp. OGB3]